MKKVKLKIVGSLKHYCSIVFQLLSNFHMHLFYKYNVVRCCFLSSADNSVNFSNENDLLILSEVIGLSYDIVKIEFDLFMSQFGFVLRHSLDCRVGFLKNFVFVLLQKQGLSARFHLVLEAWLPRLSDNFPLCNQSPLV